MSSRTLARFVFSKKSKALYKSGLIRGGSLENAVVIRDDAVLTNEPLRYPEEFVRHKILDIVGDLRYLVARFSVTS
jgi:UDP-3-O-[3-hydroxymyristoyl] N-acetylglucosamine deacetylase/3-hydroxyacyl-[acyl-carrier-protein] dehydratase